MQKQTAKMKSTRKTGKEEPGLKKSTLRKNQLSKSTQVNGLVNDDVSRWRGRWRHQGLTSAGENWRVTARGESWRRMEARGGAWRRVERVINRTETLSDTWGRMRSLTVLRLSRFCRSAQDDLCGSFKIVIEVMFVVVMRAAVVCAVWNSLTTAAASSEPKDYGWMTSEVQRRKAAAVVVMAEAMLKKIKNESH